MEALIHCAKDSFREGIVAFDEEDPPLPRLTTQPQRRFDTLDIRHAIIGTQSRQAPEIPAVYDLSQRNASELDDFFPDQRYGNLFPQLRLIRVDSRFADLRASSTARFALDITRSLFEKLLDRLRANPWVLWLLSSGYDGLHHQEAQGSYAETYFFGIYQYAIVWTFEPNTACTKVLLISRALSDHSSLYELLGSNMPYLFTPYVPMMAVAVETMLDYDALLEVYRHNIMDVEKGTGFTWLKNNKQDLSFDVDALAMWSRVTAAVQIDITNLMRHHENCVRALDLIIDARTKGKLSTLDLAYQDDYDSSMTELVKATELLKMRSNSFIPYATYLKARAEAQNSVIFSLLTHEDSVSNLKAAEASMLIAEATKRDSSAMKTIAFMTMAFLPATFLATFFALPVLEWDHKTSVQLNGFQLYWIVAVLSTAFVFVAWALVTKWHEIWNRVFGRRRATNGSEKEG